MTFKREEIQFEEIDAEIISGQRLYKTPAGNFPSVTTVLSVKDSGYLEDWRKAVGEDYANWVTEEAGKRGSRFHDYAERYLKNEDIKINDWVMKAQFNQVKPIFDRDFEVIYANEIPLYSKKLKVAGRCDCIAKVAGLKRIVDFKTSRRSKDASEIDGYRMQASVYSFMLEEMFGIHIPDYYIIISTLESSKPSIFTGNREDHLTDFARLRVKFKKMYGI